MRTKLIDKRGYNLKSYLAGTRKRWQLTAAIAVTIGLSALMSAVLLSGSTALAAGEQMTMGMPFTGNWAYNAATTTTSCATYAHPSCHDTTPGPPASLLGYHWAVDYYAGDGTSVKINGTSPQGTVTFSSVSVAGQSCGSGLIITAKANNVSAGEVYVTHLANAVTGTLSNEAAIGTVFNGGAAYNYNGCYNVDHVHFSYKNTGGNYSCYVNHSIPNGSTAGMQKDYGTPVGVFGSTNTGVRGVCDSLPSGGGTTPAGRIAFINNNNAPYAKDNISTGGWHPLLGATDSASYINASKTHLAIITGGNAWGADVSATSLSNNSPGFVPLNVPTTAGYPAGVKKIVSDKDGNMIAINNCNAAYGWRNIAGGQQWVSMTSCGDAKDVDVGSGRFGLWNSCNGAYVSDIGYAWTQYRPCNDAKAVAIGETGRVMIINSANTAYIYNPGPGTWVAKGAVGDAQKIAIGKDRVIVIVNSGAAWASDVGQDASAPMVRITNTGDALAITAGADDRMGFISASGAAWASDTITPGGSWTSESSTGDAKMLVVG